ncbi:hypothetical protein ATANTOWER_016574 [Ataeniobius toweri]|uniref:Uncharacterized protein n=1 Tax=Ataeniobius toweri TaxID=208326 RepID=A0ABU7B292_9TELE|nr:hypothetical protein [Ataeniobius toweri]
MLVFCLHKNQPGGIPCSFVPFKHWHAVRPAALTYTPPSLSPSCVFILDKVMCILMCLRPAFTSKSEGERGLCLNETLFTFRLVKKKKEKRKSKSLEFGCSPQSQLRSHLVLLV